MDTKRNKRIDCSDEVNCCGCMACVNVCGHHAIRAVENKNGFLMPEIDATKCVDCGLCVRVCDFKKDHVQDSNIQHAYSLIVNDKSILKQSTSGGAFTVLSDIILSKGGVVIGCVIEQDFTVHHVMTKDQAIRDRMRGSKYVQSDISTVYKETKLLLEEEVPVMFTGTPCQCAALKSYLGKEYDKLIIVDILCHGVPSNRLFKDHVLYLEKFYGQNIVGYSFRDKRYGWDSYNNICLMEDGSVRTKWINQVYYNFFVSNVSLRPSCHNCAYRSHHRPSDITVADFWGIEKLIGKKNHTGVSLVLTHNEKGKELVEAGSVESIIDEIPVEKIKYRVSTKPCKSKQSTEKFWDTYQQGGYALLVEQYFDASFKKSIKYEIRKIVKKFKLA